jgi:hypothetical protein
MEKMAKILRMRCERMEETQLTITTEANEKKQAYPFRVGHEVFLDTRLLPGGYVNVTGKPNESNNSQKFQYPYAGPFTLLRKAGENAFVLDILSHPGSSGMTRTVYRKEVSTVRSWGASEQLVLARTIRSVNAGALAL